MRTDFAGSVTVFPTCLARQTVTNTYNENGVVGDKEVSLVEHPVGHPSGVAGGGWIQTCRLGGRHGKAFVVNVIGAKGGVGQKTMTKTTKNDGRG